MKKIKTKIIAWLFGNISNGIQISHNQISGTNNTIQIKTDILILDGKTLKNATVTFEL